MGVICVLVVIVDVDYIFCADCYIWVSQSDMIKTQTQRFFNEFSIRFHKEKVQYLEDNGYVVFSKALLLLFVSVFIIQPLFLAKVIESNPYRFLNGGWVNSFLYSFGIFCLLYFFGFIHCKTKKALISTLDISLFLLVVGVCVSLPSNLIFYPAIFYPINYLTIGALGWFCGSIFFSDEKNCKSFRSNFGKLFENIPSDINTDDPPSKKSSIILDLCISEIADKKKTVWDVDREGLNFFPLALNILSASQSISSNKSITIGINGCWGSGKSSLIDLIKEIKDRIGKETTLNDSDIEKDIVEQIKTAGIVDEIEILEFKPWLYPDENSLMQNFFKAWKDKIDDLRVQIAFEDYSQHLLSFQFASSKWDVFNLFRSKDSLSKTKKVITDYLKSSPVKYIVVIDDLDRVETNEILEVSKLTRAIADFPNTIYLLSYDRKYIDELLKERLKSENGVSFFDKIIQVEFKIPQATERQISNQLLTLLELNIDYIGKWDTVIDKATIQKLVKDIDELGIYQEFTPTIRDVKRFLNGLLLKYAALRSKSGLIEFNRLLAFEMCFYTHKEFYGTFFNARKKFKANLQKANRNRLNDLEGFFKYLKLDESYTHGMAKLINYSFNSLSPEQSIQLIDYYYSYDGIFNYSTDEFNYLMSLQDSSEVNVHLSKVVNEDLLLSFFKEATGMFVNLDDKNKSILSNRLNLLSEQLAKKKIALTIEVQRIIAEYIANQFSLVASNDKRAVDSFSAILLRTFSEFTVYKSSYNLEELKQYNRFILRTNNPYGSFSTYFMDRDDLYSEKLIPLNKKVELEVKHSMVNKFWRFGIIFTNNDTLPFYLFRHKIGYPLFHLHPSMNDSLGSSFYIDGKSEKTTGLVSVKNSGSFGVSIYREDGWTYLTLLNDDPNPDAVKTICIGEYSKAGVVAWADGKHDFSFDVTINVVENQ